MAHPPGPLPEASHDVTLASPNARYADFTKFYLALTLLLQKELRSPVQHGLYTRQRQRSLWLSSHSVDCEAQGPDRANQRRILRGSLVLCGADTLVRCR